MTLDFFKTTSNICPKCGNRFGTPDGVSLTWCMCSICGGRLTHTSCWTCSSHKGCLMGNIPSTKFDEDMGF